MKKYTLLRFFIFCSCVISNVQVFAMENNNTIINITGQKAGIGYIAQVGGNVKHQ